MSDLVSRLRNWLNRRELTRIADMWTPDEQIPVADLIRWHDMMAIELATKEPQTRKIDRILGVMLASARALESCSTENKADDGT